jgi:tetratricopeptide (TPR) repeat protein
MARIALGIAVALLAAGSSRAAVTVMGNGPVAQCSAAAHGGEARDEDITACNEALVISTPEQKAGTYVNLGVLLLRRKQYDAARADFDAAEQLNPALGEAVINRGASFIAQKRYMEGLLEIDRGLALNPEEPQKAYFNRAIANEGLDDKEAAYLDYAMALQLAPDWEAPLQQMQRLYPGRDRVASPAQKAP